MSTGEVHCYNCGEHARIVDLPDGDCVLACPCCKKRIMLPEEFIVQTRQRTFNQTRERCAKVLDEMAEMVKREAIPIRDDAEGVLIALEAGSARIRALPEEESNATADPE